MNKFISIGIVALVFLTALNARQIQSDTPRDMNSMMRMMQMKQMDQCFMSTKDVEINVTDTKDGVALTFKPKDPSQLETLRKNVRAYAEMMQSGACGMMQGIMGNSHSH